MTNTAIDFSRKPTADMEPEFWVYWDNDGAWTLVFVERWTRGAGARVATVAVFEWEGQSTYADLDELRMPKLVCSECGEPAQEQPPAAPQYATQRFSHLDGEPLCPRMGPDGYEPGDAV